MDRKEEREEESATYKGYRTSHGYWQAITSLCLALPARRDRGCMGEDDLVDAPARLALERVGELLLEKNVLELRRGALWTEGHEDGLGRGRVRLCWRRTLGLGCLEGGGGEDDGPVRGVRRLRGVRELGWWCGLGEEAGVVGEGVGGERVEGGEDRVGHDEDGEGGAGGGRVVNAKAERAVECGCSQRGRWMEEEM